jgi:hypothetical protein
MTGANVNVRNRAGRSALMEPTMNGRNDIVQALMNAGADPRLRDNSGYCVMMLASRNQVAGKLFNDFIKIHGSKTDEPPLLSPAGGALLGRSVRLTGLSARPELNGLAGVALDFDSESERYVVKLNDGDTVRVRPTNLQHDVVLSATCAGCGAEGARRRCSRCLTVFFCNTDCQQSNWSSHKGACTAAAERLIATVPQREVPAMFPRSHAAAPSKPRNKGDPPRVGVSFVVKVQITEHLMMRSMKAREMLRAVGLELPADHPLLTDDDPELDALLIYNADRSVMTRMFPDDSGYQGLVDAILSGASALQKGYFRATRNSKGLLKINFAEILPIEKW